MKSSIFRFKHFTVKQEISAMKIGTDGTLLGAWCNCENAKNILDIGTGTGLIALMIAQRNQSAIIDAIELDNVSANEAQYNFENSNWKERLNLIHSSFQKFETDKKYDLIVSNPPFFTGSQKNKSNSKTNARHNDALPFNVLIEKSLNFLKEKGILSIVLPINESKLFIELAEQNSLRLIRKTKVYSNTNSINPFRYLMEFSKERINLKEDSIIIEKEKRHQYTEVYQHLLKDFLLKF